MTFLQLDYLNLSVYTEIIHTSSQAWLHLTALSIV